MAYLTIDHWDAVDLFSQIIAKYEKVSLAEFYDNAFLIRRLNGYKKKEAAGPVSTEIFGLKTIEKKIRIEEDERIVQVEVPKRPKAFYELNRMIRYSQPIVMEEDVLHGYLRYLNLKTSHFKVKRLQPWEPSDKHRRFEGTKWLLYYYHQENEKKVSTNKQPIPGIAKSVLLFNHFGKVELNSYKESESYIGKFDIYDKEEKYLLLEMKLKGSIKKDLHILLYIGTPDVPALEVILGQFHNLGRSIYSGTIMIEPVTSKNKKKATPAFYQGDKIKDLPEYVQLYFKEKRKNILRVPCKVTSKDDFFEWFQGKNPSS